MKYKSYYLLCLALVILDQLTKQIIVSLFTLGESMVINSYLSWTYIQNTGAEDNDNDENDAPAAVEVEDRTNK